MDIGRLKENIISVKERIAAAARGREVTLVAATKTVPAEIVSLLPGLGVTIAGENRVQEFLGKYEELKQVSGIRYQVSGKGQNKLQTTNYKLQINRANCHNAEPNDKDPGLLRRFAPRNDTADHTFQSGLEWQFIGRLQTNKVKYIVDKVSMVQSVDRLELAEELSRRVDNTTRANGNAGNENTCNTANVIGNENAGNLDILIEVNAGGEANKGGVTPEELVPFAHSVADRFKNLTVRGMMPVLPIGAPEALYLRMAALYGELKRELTDIKYLSMGMSGDFTTAVSCGANMVRLGTAIFGARS